MADTSTDDGAFALDANGNRITPKGIGAVITNALADVSAMMARRRAGRVAATIAPTLPGGTMSEISMTSVPG